MPAKRPESLPVESLRWRCDPARLPFETTADVEPIAGIIGQVSAVEALQFGLECDAEGQNVFVRGLTGTGRMTLVRRLLEGYRPACSAKQDRCYVHNFSQPDRPRLITVPAGRARDLRRRVQRFAEFVRDRLPAALNAGVVKARRESLERRAEREIKNIVEPFEKELREANLALVSIQMGPMAQTAIFPLVDGKPAPPEEYEQLRAQGRIGEDDYKAFRERREAFQRRLQDVTEQMRKIHQESAHAIHSLMEETARAILGEAALNIVSAFPGDDVKQFVSEMVNDVVDRPLAGRGDEDGDPTRLYGVNILVEHRDDDICPVVLENTPTLANLLGTVEREWQPSGPGPSDYRMIRAGSLLRADGGYLILDARDTLGEPGAWKVLIRTLRTGRLEIIPQEFYSPFWGSSIKPEPIPVRLRVILMGDNQIYHLLDRFDPEFNHLFKVLADFDTVIDRDPEGVSQYAGVLSRIAREEKLPPFHRTAVAAIAEYGARVAAFKGKLTARFSRVADIAREAAFLCRRREADTVSGDDVIEAVRRTKRRADLPSRRFQELLRDGTIRIQTEGSVVGQVNGLAVLQAGMLTYGFPARITATIGAGTAGIIDIEGQAALSGAIHTKGFHILGGLLRNLLRAEHPLAFSASLAFEQSYGGIDGDSASTAEICCLLSALTGVGIDQSLAVTGAIDQMGHVQAIGGVNEKIEGFYDACREAGLTGSQGVIIPSSNAHDLMLRWDVVDACAEGKFHVYTVDTVHQVLELLTAMPAGQRAEDGAYPDGSLLRLAVDKARDFWLKSLQTPVARQTGAAGGAATQANGGEDRRPD